jgi:hypothetical protein
MLAKHLPFSPNLTPWCRSREAPSFGGSSLSFKDQGHGYALGEFAMPGFGRKARIFDLRQRLF